MDIQQVMVYVLLGIAVGFLVKKFFFKKNSKKGCGKDNDCGCH